MFQSRALAACVGAYGSPRRYPRRARRAACRRYRHHPRAQGLPRSTGGPRRSTVKVRSLCHVPSCPLARLSHLSRLKLNPPPHRPTTLTYPLHPFCRPFNSIKDPRVRFNFPRFVAFLSATPPPSCPEAQLLASPFRSFNPLPAAPDPLGPERNVSEDNKSREGFGN